jgi:hypothetical protein
MLKALRFPVLLLFLCATGLFFTLRTSHSQDVTLPNSVPRFTFLAYDTFGPDWQTTMLLNNTTRVPLIVHPIVYSPNGASAKLPTIRLEAHEHRRLSFD